MMNEYLKLTKDQLVTLIEEKNKEIEKLVKWCSPESAPRTGEIIMADMGWPWPCLVCWNKSQEEWVYVTQQMNSVEGQEDPYFENEYGQESALKRWMPLPELVT